MNKRGWSRVLSVLLTIAMLASLLVVPAAALATEDADNGIYVLDFTTSGLTSGTTVAAAGESYGTATGADKKYFTVYEGQGKATENSFVAIGEADGEDYIAAPAKAGIVWTPNGATQVKSVNSAKIVQKAIAFTPNNAGATVKIWWWNRSTATDKTVVIYTYNSETETLSADLLQSTEKTTSTKGDGHMDTFTCTSTDTYYIGGTDSGIGIARIEVVDQSSGPSIAVTPATAEVEVDKTTTLTANVENADGATVIWTSSPESVATVDSNGVVTGVAEGEATITASIIVNSTEYTATATVTVKAAGSVVYVTGVTIDGDADISLAEGGTTTLTATVAGTDGNAPADTGVTWSTSDEDVATVDASGVVTAVAAGTATITATSNGDKADGSKATASVTVTVTAKPKVYSFDKNATINFGTGVVLTKDASSGTPQTATVWDDMLALSANTDDSDKLSSAVGTQSGGVLNYKGVEMTRGFKTTKAGRHMTFTAPEAGTLSIVLFNVNATKDGTADVGGTLTAITNAPTPTVIDKPLGAGESIKVGKGAGTADPMIFLLLWKTGDACAHTSMKEAVKLTDPTCGEAGTKIKWCANDACFACEIVAGDAATGAHAEYEWKTVTAATDDADGVREYVCKACGTAGSAPAGESTVIPKLSHTATVTATNGTVTLSGDDVTANGGGSYKIKNGSTVTVTATPGDGYEGGAVTVDGTALEGTTFTMPAKDVAVAATFTAKVPEITLSKDSVEVKVGANTAVTVTVTNGTIAGVSAVANSGSDGGSANATYNSNTGAITITGIAKGTATVTVSLAGAESKTIAVTVKGADEHAHHYEVDEEASVASTCSTKGKKVEKCTSDDGVACDAPTVETELALDPTNHKGPIADKDGTAVAPTCGAAGKAADKACAACGATTQTGAAIDPTGAHTFKDADGKDLEKCSVCNADNPDYVSDALWDLDFTVTETLAKDATVESVEGIKLTMGSAFTWYAANAAGTSGEVTLPAEAGMAGVLKSSSGGPSDRDAIPADGKSYLKFDATKDGTLTVAYAVFGDNAKNVRVLDSTGAAVADAGKTGFKGNGDSTFDVKAGGTYYVFAGGANIGFYGFSFTADEGGEPNPPAPETKSITFTIGEGASVTDIKVDGEAATLPADKKLVDIAKNAVVTFVAAVTDPAKVLKVTGATFADGVYTVTADTVVITAKDANAVEYTVSVDGAIANGTVTVSPDKAEVGETITVTATPAEGYKLEAIKVDGETITGNTFTMPAKDVTVSATFVADGGNTPGGDDPVALTGKYTFDATKIAVDTATNVAVTNDLVKAATTVVTTDATPVDAMFTVEGSVLTKLETEGFAGTVELAKKEGGKIIFTIPAGSTATVTVAACSTNTTNESAYAMKKDGEVVANDGELVSVVAGNEPTMIVYTDLGAGTYEIVSPTDADRSRGMRIVSVEVNFGGATEPGPGPDKPGPGPDDPGTDTVDTKALSDAIAAAEKLAKDTYTVSNDTTASKVDSGKKFVKQSAKDALEAAIAAAKDAMAAATTQEDVTKAQEALATAVATFNKAIQTGTKKTNGSTGSSTSRPSSSRPNSSTATVSNAAGGTTTTAKDASGNVTITATDDKGEVLAEVKLPGTIPALDTKFVDVPEGHWAEKSINAMAALDLVKGVNETQHIFDMVSPITRGSVATILSRLANGKADAEDIFSDVAEGQWFAEGVAWAAKAGVVNGFENGTFRPDDSITREQLAVMLARYAKLLGLDTTAANSELAVFDDADSVQSWALEGMAWCVKAGIINGRGDGTVDPGANATRAEAAAMLARLVDLLK